MPRADATELAPKKSAHQSPPAVPDSGAGGLFVFRQEQNKKACISLVKLPSGGSGLQNAKTARPLLPGAPNCFAIVRDTTCAYTSEYPIPLLPVAMQSEADQFDNRAGNHPEEVEGNECHPLHVRLEHRYLRLESVSTLQEPIMTGL